MIFTKPVSTMAFSHTIAMVTSKQLIILGMISGPGYLQSDWPIQHRHGRMIPVPFIDIGYQDNFIIHSYALATHSQCKSLNLYMYIICRSDYTANNFQI